MRASVKKHSKRKNLLLRYQSVMEEFDKHDCRDVPITVIYRKYIYPKFHISHKTLYNIINTDINGELSTIEKQTKEECPTLF